MVSERFSFESWAKDKKRIYAVRHRPGPPASGAPVPQIPAAVIISHGMGDYKERYDEFSEYLCGSGLEVYICDHRGHGETGEKDGSLGILAEKDGWNRAASDLKQLVKICRDDNPETPVFLLGHSFGSFLALTFAVRWGEMLDGLILSGTGSPSKAVLAGGKIAAGTAAAVTGGDRSLFLINALCFAGFAMSVRDAETRFDWICSDMKVVRKFVSDPLSQFLYSNSFYLDLVDGLNYNQDPENLSRIPPDLPFYLISGSEDPVGDFTDGVRKTAGMLADAGVEDLTCTFYKGERHEILNGRKKTEVFTAVAEWIQERVR